MVPLQFVRCLNVVLFFGFHLSMHMTLDIAAFHLVGMSTQLLLIPASACDALEEFITKERLSPFSSYYDRKARILGNLHGILVEDPEGILINPGPVASVLLRRERPHLEDVIHHQVEKSMKTGFEAFNVERTKAFENLTGDVQDVIK